jgi:hypothetical protein
MTTIVNGKPNLGRHKATTIIALSISHLAFQSAKQGAKQIAEQVAEQVAEHAAFQAAFQAAKLLP